MDYRDTDRTSHCIGGSMSTVDLRGRFWTSPTVTFLAVSMQSYTRLLHDLFSNNEQGFVYDPNDLSTMYQDAAGTVPVTAAGQPVGLVLDKSKMVASTRRNLLTYTDDFTNASWHKTSTAASTSPSDNGLVLAPDGSVTARSYTFTSQTFIRQLITLASGNVGYQSIWVRKGAVSPANAIRLTQNNTLAWNTGGSLKIPLTTQWQRISFNSAATGTAVRYIIFGSVDAAGTNDTDCNGSIEVWHPQYELNSVTDYQKVDSPYGGWIAGNHAYQTTSASRPILRKNAVTGANYLEFDGSDDFLRTNSIDFTATDEVSLFAGVRKLSDSNTAVVAELSTTSDNGKAFTLFAPALGGTAKFLFRSGGSIVNPSGGALTTDTKYSAPFTAVAVGKSKISMDYMSLKLNGAVVGDVITDQGTGNYGNYPLFIGRRGGTSLPFNGYIYGLIGIGKLTSDNETTAIEKELAKRTGVTLNV